MTESNLIITIFVIVLVMTIIVLVGYDVLKYQSERYKEFCIEHPDFYGAIGDNVINCSKHKYN